MKKRRRAKRYVLITGGNLVNKGAQAMVFVAVDEVKRRFPDKEVVVVSDVDAARSPEELARYNFLFRDGTCIYGWKYKLVQHRYGKLDRYKDAATIRNNIDMIVDVSGYTFGSNWGVLANVLAAYRCTWAKRRYTPTYFMPQSFGPFEWTGIKAKVADYFLRHWLATAKVIYAREKESYELFRRRYRIQATAYAVDLVLQNRGVDYGRIFKDVPQADGTKSTDLYVTEKDLPSIRPHSVGILPSIRSDQYGGAERMDALYRGMIDKLLEMGRTVYLIRHATEDLECCRRIKAFYEKEQRVILLEEDFECFAYSALAARFDYLVASRYHAVVHAYKAGTPCIVPGWAVKYRELLQLFEQDAYSLDVRTVTPEEAKDLLDRMEADYAGEAEKIKEHLAKVQRGNVFDCLSVYRVGRLKKIPETPSTVEEVVHEIQCVSCGICAAVCPEDCIHYERTFGYFFPVIEEAACVRCGKCLRVCPGRAKTHELPFIKPCGALTAQAKDEELLFRATSGGVVTAMVERLLRDGVYDNAYLVDGHSDFQQLYTREFRAGDDLSVSQKSRYVPVSQQKAVEGILSHPDTRSIFVGCACAVYGLLEAMKLSGADRERVLIIGLFCDRTMTYAIYDYFRDYCKAKKLNNGKLCELHFRDKRAGGWPGDMHFTFTDGSTAHVSAKERMVVKDFFQGMHCADCTDKLNRQADISVGDNYTGKNSDKRGTSSVLLYTERGAAAWEHCADAFVTAPSSAEEICRSQHVTWEQAFGCTKDGLHSANWEPPVRDDHDAIKLMLDCSYGEWGMNRTIREKSIQKKKELYRNALRERLGK